MAATRTTPSQFEIMMDFMERHGDIGKTTEVYKRLEHLRRWIELTELLNSHSSSGESAKPVEKWRKVWSDLKNNTKKKIEKTKKYGSKVPPMSDMEKRVIKFMACNTENKRKISVENDSILIKTGASLETKITFLPELRRSQKERIMNLAAYSEEEEDETLRKSESPSLRYFYIVDDNSKTQDSASSYTPSASSPQPTPAKRKKSNDDMTNSDKRKSNDHKDKIDSEKRIQSNDHEDMTDIEKRRKSSNNEDLKEIANKFLEFEKEKDRRSHETEMARLKQNDRLISVVGRIVNVLETLTPCFQSYLNKNLNDGG